jgi:putative transcriptional regulator
LKPREYGPEQVRAVRAKLNASQALLARFLGINTATVSAWEQGRRKVPPMARRYLDDLIDFPALWATRTGMAAKET